MVLLKCLLLSAILFVCVRALPLSGIHVVYLYKKLESGSSPHLRRKRGSIPLPSERWLQNVIYWADSGSELAVLVPAIEAPRPAAQQQQQQAAPVGPSPTHSAYMTPSASTQLLDADGGGGRVPDVLSADGVARPASTSISGAKLPADSDNSAPPSPSAGAKVSFRFDGTQSASRGETGEPADVLAGGYRAPRTPHNANANVSPFGQRGGSQSGLLTGGDPKVCVVWLERFEDRDTLPIKDLLSYAAGRALLPPTSSASNVQLNERDVFVICLHVLRRSGLIRVSVQNTLSLASSSRASPARGGAPAGASSIPGPLVDGMVVSRAALAPLLRHTILNIYRRRRLEASTDPPHVRRKTRINEMLKKYRCRIGDSDFFVSLFQEPY